jgi:hypothetical protein
MVLLMSIRTARIPAIRTFPNRARGFRLRRRHRRGLMVAAILVAVIATAFIAGYEHRAITQQGLRYSSDDVSRLVGTARGDAYREGVREGERDAVSQAVTSTCMAVFGVGRVRSDGWRAAAREHDTLVRATVWRTTSAGARTRFTREDCIAIGEGPLAPGEDVGSTTGPGS